MVPWRCWAWTPWSRRSSTWPTPSPGMGSSISLTSVRLFSRDGENMMRRCSDRSCSRFVDRLKRFLCQGPCIYNKSFFSSSRSPPIPFEWLCMTLYDFVWLCMTMYDYEWLMYDYVWICTAIYNSVWLRMTLYDHT